jgi:hypothetical protein
LAAFPGLGQNLRTIVPDQWRFFPPKSLGTRE